MTPIPPIVHPDLARTNDDRIWVEWSDGGWSVMADDHRYDAPQELTFCATLDEAVAAYQQAWVCEYCDVPYPDRTSYHPWGERCDGCADAERWAVDDYRGRCG
jgi:hypothetical protein